MPSPSSNAAIATTGTTSLEKLRHFPGKHKSRDERENGIGTYSLIPLIELPQGRQKKVTLLLLHELIEAKRALQRGLGNEEAVVITIDPVRVQAATPGRIIRDDLIRYIRENSVTTKDGGRITVFKYRDEKKREVVVAADAEAVAVAGLLRKGRGEEEEAENRERKLVGGKKGRKRKAA